MRIKYKTRADNFNRHWNIRGPRDKPYYLIDHNKPVEDHTHIIFHRTMPWGTIKQYVVPICRLPKDHHLIEEAKEFT